MAELTLKETAVTRHGDLRIGCGNVWEREYALPDGTLVTGMSARVSVGGEVHYIGMGSELRLGDETWLVTSIDKVPGELGLVYLES